MAAGPPERMVLERARRKLNAFYDFTQKPLTIPRNLVVDSQSYLVEMRLQVGTDARR